ncbi:MAG: DNA-3-methyladenine glycosylase 2 family protein [Planctomycetes bacterium]|nr:DNA-3-methyladenine glycosylase 2 family protein [Planctomycetota bacterium]
MIKPLNRRSLLEGVKILAQKDKDLAKIVTLYGPPPLWAREQGFPTLIHIILEQQVSLQSAKAAYNKLESAINPITPERFLKLTDAKLKKIGFSRQKTKYGRELATAVLEGKLDLSNLNHLGDEEAKIELIKVKGIGPWTADIYLLMAMGRPDIWPKGDLALEVALQSLRGLENRPKPEQLVNESKKWQPWRAVAARLLWHYYLSAGKRS